MSVSGYRPGDNVATPHSEVEGKLAPLAFSRVDNTAPAGSINSSAADMAKWMIVQLNAGALPGKPGQRLFSERVHREMWTPQTILPNPDPPAPLKDLRTNFLAYGLAWVLGEYRGHFRASHTGGLPGYVSQVALIPDVKLGVVVLTSQESSAMFDSVTAHVLDAFLGAPPVDWIQAYQQYVDQSRARAAAVEKKQSATRAAESKPSLALEKYAGRYVDAWYGDMTIALESARPGDALQPLTRAHGRSRTLAVRHVQSALARPQSRRRRLRDILLESGRIDQRDQNGSGIATDRFQLRLPRSVVRARPLAAWYTISRREILLHSRENPMQHFQAVAWVAALLAAGPVAEAQTIFNPAPSRIAGQAVLQQFGLLTATAPNLVEGRELNGPQALAIDTSASPPILYVADTGNNRVLAWKDAFGFTKGDAASKVIGQRDFLTTAAQGPGADLSTGLYQPVAVAIDKNGNLYVIDAGNNRILRYPAPLAQTGDLLTVDLILGQRDLNGRVPNAGQSAPSDKTFAFATGAGIFRAGLAFDSQGNLWVSDPGNNRVLRFPASALGTGAAESAVGRPGARPAGFQFELAAGERRIAARRIF